MTNIAPRRVSGHSAVKPERGDVDNLQSAILDHLLPDHGDAFVNGAGFRAVPWPSKNKHAVGGFLGSFPNSRIRARIGKQRNDVVLSFRKWPMMQPTRLLHRAQAVVEKHRTTLAKLAGVAAEGADGRGRVPGR